jgi:hypothetical protein
MKKLAKVLMVLLCVGSMTFLLSCGDDDEGGMDPNVFCDENLCSTDNDLKEECIDAFNTCMENNVDANDDECAATALLICRI